LRADNTQLALPSEVERQEVQLPHAYPRPLALARAVTAHDTTTYDKVESLITWIGAHTHYSLDIPPLPPGADTVDEFLFGNRVGFCEQISTSLAVMLRSLGIPAREAVGYVPGGFDPITDLYQVHADDAHAWVQVWFPGYGWQNFDPTATVPLAAPSPGSVALHDVGSALGRVPVVPVLLVLVVGGLIAIALRRSRARPPTWAELVAQRAELCGRRAHLPRHAAETLSEYAARLDAHAGPGVSSWRRLASSVEASAYGGHDPPASDQRAMLEEARRLRLRPRRGAGPDAPSGANPPVSAGSGARR
jgi:hypothetical protein